MSSIFGGSKSKSTSYNKAYDQIKTTFSPLTQYAGTGAEGISKLLSGDSSGFDAYKNATGFDQLLEYGSRGITGNAAARGLLRSGSSGKALVDYGNMMQNQYADNYLARLLGLSNIGTNAGQLISGAGGVSNSSSKQKNGIGGFLGSLASGIAASDRRLKDNIKKIGETKDGLGLYTFTYKGDTKKWRGVMADEVAELRPWALGPVIDGYQTVDYEKLWSN